MDAAKIVRALAIVTTSMVAAASVIYVQTRFDEADRKAGLAVVQDYRSHSGRSIPELLDEQYPGKTPHWQTGTESSCFQYIAVHAIVDAEPRQDFEFIVDINGPSIHPGNPAGERLLRELDEPFVPPNAADAATP